MKQLAKAIKESGQSRYQISKATGIDQAVLCRIATGSGSGSCSLKTLDVLCEYLGLELVKKNKKSKKAKSAPASKSGNREMKQGR